MSTVEERFESGLPIATKIIRRRFGLNLSSRPGLRKFDFRKQVIMSEVPLACWRLAVTYSPEKGEWERYLASSITNRVIDGLREIDESRFQAKKRKISLERLSKRLVELLTIAHDPPIGFEIELRDELEFLTRGIPGLPPPVRQPYPISELFYTLLRENVTIPQLAKVLGCHKQTIRRAKNAALAIIDARRPNTESE